MLRLLRSSSLFTVFTAILTAYSVTLHEVITGDDVTLQCRVPTPYSVHSLFWKRENKKITITNSKYGISTGLDVFALFVKNASVEDAGIYSCTAYFEQVSQMSYKEVFHLQVQDFPRLFINDQLFIEGDVVEVKCCAYITIMSRVPTVHWVIPPNEVVDIYFRESGETRMYKNKTEEYCRKIQFIGNRKHHGQNITCLMENYFNLTASLGFQILYPAETELFILNSACTASKNCTIEEGSDLIMGCKTDANPRKNAYVERKTEHNEWRSLDVKYIATLGEGTVTTNSITISNINRNFSGYYRCVAYYNESNSAVSYRFIDVLYPAHITLVTQSPIQIEMRGNITIECETDGNPKPDVKLERHILHDTWISLSNAPTRVLKRGCKVNWAFHFHEVDEKISGSYRCSAHNGIESTVFAKTMIIYVKYTGVSATIPSFHNYITPAFVTFSTFVLLLFMIVVAVCIFLFYNQRNRQSRRNFHVNTRCTIYTEDDNYCYPDVVLNPASTSKTGGNLSACRALPECPEISGNDGDSDYDNPQPRTKRCTTRLS